ncbi:MtrAB system histidine kinase MtrB [Nocardioides nanhaiensis]|uniref:Sensor histidine kinase MtrB n=1 Tax=Nocardioides nanhaiensis TaxID=1476871 RepID=A0ABP8VYL1_9ACTN
MASLRPLRLPRLPRRDPARPSRRSQGISRVVPAGVRRAFTFWRRSIQARVATSTVLLSAVVIAGVGWLLTEQTRDGLLQNRAEVVVAEAISETNQATDRLAAAEGTEFDAVSQQAELARPIIRAGEARDFGVLLGGPVGSGTRLADGGAERTANLETASVPESLEARFDEVATTAWTFSEVVRSDPETGETTREPGIVVGSQVQLPADGNVYTLYYVFPLEEQQETLALVTRALATGAVVLLVLVAAITWLVTRQVVTPIRMARRVAERLAAGRLQERLRVRGEDDLARLAISFNQMAANLQKQIRQLEELSRVQQQFASDVSHELRTPLTTVRMAGDVLHDARADFDPVTARSAELLQTELDRFETLLEDLLEISRFDAGAAVLDLEDINLADVAHRVVHTTRTLAERRGVDVRVLLPEGPTARPCVAEVDARRVERVVRNLVTNAIDHAGPDGQVLVRLGCDGDAAAVAVRDFGVGLAPGESALVFNRFWRGDPARARTSGGTGLGLSISLEDTRLHGGWLQAWGRPGEGSQFRLTLPRHAGDTLRSSPLSLVPDDAARRPGPDRRGVGAR